MMKIDERKSKYARNCVSKFGVHMHVLEVVKVH